MSEINGVTNNLKMSPLSVPIYLSRSLGDRLLLAIFAPIVAALTGVLTCFALLFGPGQPDIVIRAGALMVAAVGFTFFCFSVLVFTWALFEPAWVERLLASWARRVLLTVAFLVSGVALGAVYFST